MFLIRLLYVRKKIDSDDLLISNEKNTVIETDNKINVVTKKTLPETKTIENSNTTIGQIKNTVQEKKINESLIKIDTFDNLVNTCIEKRELKLKYELENNVSLVSFEIPRIEISFNENLDKNFVKDISSKLYEWTNQRWIISFSKLQGDIPITKMKSFKKNKILEEAKDSKIYKKFLESFSDADLLSKINIDKEND